jgi:hypothetical protein
MKPIEINSPEFTKEVIRKVELFEKYSKAMAELKSISAIKQQLILFITEYNQLT